MTKFPTDQATLPATGQFEFPATSAGRSMIFEGDGNLDGNTVTIGMKGLKGTFVPYVDAAGEPITFDGPFVYQVDLGRTGVAAIEVAGDGVAMAFDVAVTRTGQQPS